MNGSRPNFFIVGAPKCGTTAWVAYLGTHSEICFSNGKEPHYFNTDMPNFRWASSLEDYLEYFKRCEGSRIVGEASVQYLYSRKAAKNIAAFAPEAKILIFLRSPGSFIRSYHNQLLMNRDEDEVDLRKAWELSGKRHGDALPKGCREESLLNYKKVALFSEQVERYLDHFPSEHVKVVFFEDWVDSPRRLYLELMSFLDVSDDGRSEFPQVHGAKQVASWWLHDLTQRPPDGSKAILSAIRRIPGLKGFSPSRLIRALNVRAGYRSAKDTQLESEIDQYFSEDQKRLYALVEEKR